MKKLSLKKVTLASLDAKNMNQVRGGERTVAVFTEGQLCETLNADADCQSYTCTCPPPSAMTCGCSIGCTVGNCGTLTGCIEEPF